jgi:ferredoxin
VINEPCIGTKDTSCVEVCPVDCIHPRPDEPDFGQAEQLYIDPEECIDCDACVEACPVDAITPEDMVPAEWQKYIRINAAYFRERRPDDRASPHRTAPTPSAPRISPVQALRIPARHHLPDRKRPCRHRLGEGSPVAVEGRDRGMTQIFTIGHSTHELAEFVQLLRAHQVGQVADVRTHPGSRRMPWFNRASLARELPAHGLRYVHLPQLGGRRRPSGDSPNGGWRVEGFRGYADHMASAEFRAGLEALQELARKRTTAVMCAEGLWWRCHRRLVSDALTARVGGHAHRSRRARHGP